MGYVLRDDHGSGDSFVNGSSVTEQLLNSGDQLLFGNTQMIFYASEGTKPFQLASSRGRELLVRKPPDTSSSTARLQFTNLQASVRSIEVLPDMTIGRSRECDIFLEDLTVSRLHATIKEYGHAEYEIVDNHSATGIFVNGRLIKRHRLQEGDMIQIGNTKFSFRLASHS
jgi:pSer/pThr/pTyr-binding forkhead associated (FHA) protein